MQHWLKKRPLLLWGFGWSVFFEVMWLLWGGKLPNLNFLSFYLTPPLWSLLLCVRPAIQRTLIVVYGLGIVAGVMLPLTSGLDFATGRALGGSCLGALLMGLLVQGIQKTASR